MSKQFLKQEQNITSGSREEICKKRKTDKESVDFYICLINNSYKRSCPLKAKSYFIFKVHT
jgi:hypothetical protein